MNFWHRLKTELSLAVTMALVLQGCATWQTQEPDAIMAAGNCSSLFNEMDQIIQDYGVADAGTARIPGFPALRIDRFLAAFAHKNLTAEVYADWLERLRQLDMTARLIEWRNLPPAARMPLEPYLRPNLETTVNACGHILAEQALFYPRQRSRLLAAIEPPDAYSTWQRFFGLYFLTRWAIVDGVWSGQQEILDLFSKTDQGPGLADRLVRYAPPVQDALGVDQVATILAQSARNPLKIPQPSKDQLTRLFASLAPVWVVDTASDNDRIGTVSIGAEDKTYIHSQTPVVYTLTSHARYGDQTLLQLNYLIWFPARTPERWLDIYAGRFDGLIWRVTLGMDGKPLAYDSIHACGCYYQIFPGEGMQVVKPEDGSEPILSPKSIPALKPDERLTIRLTSGNHFIRSVTAERAVAGATAYNWLDYHALRSLPTPDNRRLSFFNKDGLVDGSERLERFLLWPMGVPNAGAMRQWGNHAIAFLGKRHFDDPHLIEKLMRPVW